ncbi:DnaD domain protein [Lysinibacillus piscis]|uniref:Replication protein n=1 Tax=Lysinibacillus piscis TaxID=2518931 RepID=A0ABQ5NKQ4_9BACI|nr:DnaD domain protein [Lysinibacillus sp. KH24]GLC88671.1 replication protein [Lysinibacillus sp. KH24]
MSIIRVAKNSNYVVMNRTALNDNRLSWRAKGIMAYMLSMPDDWVFYQDELITHSCDGKTAFDGGFKELKKHGYVERRQVKDEQTQKITHWETIVHEIPFEPQPEKPVGGKTTHWETTHLEIHPVENQQLLSTDINQVLNKPNTDINQVLNKPNTDINQVLTTDMENTQRLYEFFVSRLQKIPSDKLREDIDFYIATYHDANLILEAFNRALTNGSVKAKEKYALATLRNWKHEGITTIELLELKEVQQNGINQHDNAEVEARKSAIRAENDRRAKLAGIQRD